MPDIDFQKIELNLIPKKCEQPVVFYASQYETARPFIAVLKWGDSEFAPGVDYHAEIDIRKNDDNLVVITDDVSIDNNEVSVILPVQALTCIGKNLGQVKIYAADDNLIAALNFILEVQADPLAGGVTSETAIDNLESQIEDIATEVIGEDYYNKTETDALLADKADKSELPDMTNYYTKTQTDDLLYEKADYSELSNYYKKYEVNNFLNAKVDKTTLQSDYYDADYISTQFARKTFVEDYVDATAKASGNPCTFDTAKYHTLIPALTANIVCGGGGGTPSTPIPLVGHSSLNLDVNGDTFTVQFGQTVYGGVYDKSGRLTITHKVVDLGTLDYAYYGGRFNTTGPIADLGGELSGDYYVNVICDSYAKSAGGENNTFFVYSNKYVYLYNSDYTDAAAFKASLSGVYLCYELATPIVIDVPSISVFAENGVNNIVSDCGGDVNVSYKDTIQHYIDQRLQ